MFNYVFPFDIQKRKYSGFPLFSNVYLTAFETIISFQVAF